MNYDEKAKDLTNRLAITGTQEDYDNIIAAALRESASEAYEDAAKIMEEIDCYCCHHDEHPEGLCLVKAKAAALRPQPSQEKP